MRSPGRSAGGRERRARVDDARARSCRCTWRRRGRARPPSCRRRRLRRPRPRAARAIASTSAFSSSAGEALLEHEGQGERERPRARHGEVVDRPVHRELADRAAGEADRLDDERVGGEGDVAAGERDDPGVAERVERGRGEGRQQQPLDQALRRLAAGAVGHRDAGVAELRALGAGRLDDAEDALLSRCLARTCGRHRPLSRARTARSCSRRRTRPRWRPCTSRSGAPACRPCRTPCTPTA